ncbi:MAG: hypothetical protein JW966_06190 [Anaerolineae bacterium]|nr:hypothetical protein [Anaerolineae bacterium]
MPVWRGEKWSFWPPTGIKNRRRHADAAGKCFNWGSDQAVMAWSLAV